MEKDQPNEEPEHIAHSKKAPMKKKAQKAVVNSKPVQKTVKLSKEEENVKNKQQKLKPVESKGLESKAFSKFPAMSANPKLMPQSKIPSVNINSLYQQKNIHAPKATGIKIRLLQPKSAEKKVVAVIITFKNGASYDQLFTSIEQKTLEGTQVLVYECDSYYVEAIHKALIEQPKEQILKELIKNIKQVDPDCVVFNWECCSSYNDKKFPEGKKFLFNFLRKILDDGHMAMFSDFSLKALIKEWDSALLGSNPFEQIGQTQAQINLHFIPAVLKQCPSAQLQMVGDMAEKGNCHIQTMPQTIIYSVNETKIDKQQYKLQVLTINTSFIPSRKQILLELDGKKGSAGHVILHYKSGGCLLTSMGHWVQLMKIDTSQHKLFEVAQREFGSQEAQSMKIEYEQLQESAKRDYVKKKAINLIQSQAPSKNMSKKMKK